jgi:diacylglycerol kinase (ATP)
MMQPHRSHLDSRKYAAKNNKHRFNREVHMPQRVIVIHSPHSGRSSKLPDAIKHLEQAGQEIVNNMSIADLDDLPAQGTTWKGSGVDVAIAAGSDGLVGGVVTHIAESGLPLGILPLGTSNGIARALHIPQDIGEAARVIAQGNELEVDIGAARPAEQVTHRYQCRNARALRAHDVSLCSAQDSSSSRCSRYSLEFEGLALPETTVSAQEGTASPVASTPETLTTLRARALQVAVINTPIFGGEREIAIARSSFAYRLLDIVVFEQMDMGTLGKDIARAFAPKKHTVAPLAPGETRTSTHHPAELAGIPGMYHVQARGVTITTSADPREATFDGEVRGHTPIYVYVADKQVKVRVPDQISKT